MLIRDPREHYALTAVLCPDQDVDAVHFVEWFVFHWSLEVTFHDVHAQMGAGTQRQWSDLAILRTMPALPGLFSLVTSFARQVVQGQSLPVRQAACLVHQDLADLFRDAG